MGELIDETLRAVLGAYGLGEALEIETLTVGAMNRNWRVRTPDGIYAVKQVQDVDVEQTRFQQATTIALADTGHRVPRPLQPLCVRPDGVFAAVPWVEGAHRHGSELTLDECGRLGALLAELHLGLAEVLPPAPSTVEREAARPETTLARLCGYATRIELKAVDDFDRYAREQIVHRITLLERYGDRRPADGARDRAGWIHGDFQQHNVLWSGDEIVAVVDWDRLKVSPLWRELSRAAMYIFDCDLDRIAAFVAAYRSVIPLPESVVRDAVHNWWYNVLTGIWPLDAHYDRGDASCDRFFVGGTERLVWWTEHYDDVMAAFVGTGR